MAKQWLSLPEAERLVVEMTGGEPESARAKILEGIRDREIDTRGRGENGYITTGRLPGAAWVREPDWKTSRLAWWPASYGGWIDEGFPWGRYLIGQVYRVSLERYFAPPAVATIPAVPPAAPNKSPPNKGGRPPEIPLRVMTKASAWLAANGCTKQAEVEAKIHELLDAARTQMANSTVRKYAKQLLEDHYQALRDDIDPSKAGN